MGFSKRLLTLLLSFLLALNIYAQEATYVLVHGAWGGAWQFKNTAKLLQKDGHVVYRPTLTGLGERFHLLNEEIDLDTHVKDVVNTILFENLNDIILVGHSYGGVVVTAVADSIPERIKKIVYIDAILPTDGLSAVESLGASPEDFLKRLNVVDHAVVPAWVKDVSKTPRDVPHPVGTFLQKTVLKNQKRNDIPATYIFTFETEKGGEEKDDFYPFYQKAVQNNWKVVKLEASHNPQIDKLEELVQILIEENNE